MYHNSFFGLVNLSETCASVMRREGCDTCMHCATDMGNVVIDTIVIPCCHRRGVTAVNIEWRNMYLDAGVIQRSAWSMTCQFYLSLFHSLSLSHALSPPYYYYSLMKTKQKDHDDESNTAFSKSQKAVIVAITVFTTAMLTALPINIYYPALSAMKEV